MTKFIPNLGEISTKSSGFETEQEPPLDRTPPDEATPNQEAQRQESKKVTLPPSPFLGGTGGQQIRQAEENIAPTPQKPPAVEKKPPTPAPKAVREEEPQKATSVQKPDISAAATKSIAQAKQLFTQATTKLPSPQNQPDSPSLRQKIVESPWLDPQNPLYRTRKFLLAAGVGVGVGGTALAVGATWWSLESSLPDPASILTLDRDGSLTIKAENGQILQQIGHRTREKVKLEDMPPQLVQAFTASENKQSVLSYLTAKTVVEGGSISQQLARMVFLNQERTWQRKFQEILLAGKIDQKLTKQQIMERYLNLVYLGEGAYGVADAAWVYYSKPLKDLTLPEIATIAGVTPAPNVFSPIGNPQVAEGRRNTVLQRMQKSGFITPEQAQEAQAAPIALQPAPPKQLSTQGGYFSSFIQQELPKYVSPDALEAGGLTVETSLNQNWQDAAEKAVQKAVGEDGPQQKFGQAGLVAIDPRNGEVKAMVGGTDFGSNNLNRATQLKRQPGSIFNGLLYATAIAGGFSPYRGYLDAPITVDDYTPKNLDGTNVGWISMKDALAKSVNVVALRVLLDVGYQPTIDTARKMGIESELKPTYSLALGGSEVNLLELTNAYGTFANKGLHAPVHGIRRVLDRQGKVVYEAKFQPQQAIDADTSSIMNWMLQDTVKVGSGRAADLNDRPVAGNTGTSEQARDLWFVGYIPQLVTGVWLGNDDNSPTSGSSSTAATTWKNFMAQAVAGMPVENFPARPEKLENRKATIAVVPIKPGKIDSAKVAYSKPKDEDEGDLPVAKSNPVKPAPSNPAPVLSLDRPAPSNPTPVARLDTQEDSDPAPVRRRSRQDDSDSTPVRRRSRQDDSDSTPVRRRSRQDDSDSTPVRRRSRQDDSDSTPVRRRSRQDNSDSTPVRRRSRQDNSDSTPRLRRRKYSENYQAVSRRRSSPVAVNTSNYDRSAPPPRRVRSQTPRRRFYTAEVSSTPTTSSTRYRRRKYAYVANNVAPRSQPVVRRRSVPQYTAQAEQPRRRFVQQNTYRAEQPRRRSVPQYTAQAAQPRRRSVPQYTAQAEQPRRRSVPQYTAQAEQPRRRSVQQRSYRVEQPRRRSVPQYTAQAEQPRRRSAPQYTAQAEQPRRRSVPQYTAQAEQPRRRSVQQSTAQVAQPRSTRRRYSTVTATATRTAPSASRRRARRASPATASAAPRQLPSLARPVPAAAPPTIELNTHR